MRELNLKKAMRDKGISIEAVAGLLQIHRNSASSKVNGATPFTIDEAFQVKNKLFPEFDIGYLFGKLSDDFSHKEAS